MKCHGVVIIELKQKRRATGARTSLHSHCFNLYYSYLISYNLFTVENFPGVDFKGQKKRRKLLCCVHVLNKT